MAMSVREATLVGPVTGKVGCLRDDVPKTCVGGVVTVEVGTGGLLAGAGAKEPSMVITISVVGVTTHVPPVGTRAAVPVKWAPDCESSKRSSTAIRASVIVPAKCRDPESVGMVKEYLPERGTLSNRQVMPVKFPA
jgi:hypothetical protein